MKYSCLLMNPKGAFLLIYAVTAKTVKKPNKTGVIPYLSAIQNRPLYAGKMGLARAPRAPQDGRAL